MYFLQKFHPQSSLFLIISLASFLRHLHDWILDVALIGESTLQTVFFGPYGLCCDELNYESFFTAGLDLEMGGPITAQIHPFSLRCLYRFLSPNILHLLMNLAAQIRCFRFLAVFEALMKTVAGANELFWRKLKLKCPYQFFYEASRLLYSSSPNAFPRCIAPSIENIWCS